MMSKPPEARIAAIARSYVEARDEATRLERERAACVCDFEPREVLLRDGFLHDEPPLRVRAGDYRGVRTTKGADAIDAPCWRHIDAGGEHGETEAIGEGSDEGWCDPCQRRQALHEQLRAARRRLPGRLSALISCTRSTVGPKLPEKPARAVMLPPRAPQPALLRHPGEDEEMPF
jgi:hypothetical protein